MRTYNEINVGYNMLTVDSLYQQAMRMFLRSKYHDAKKLLEQSIQINKDTTVSSILLWYLYNNIFYFNAESADVLEKCKRYIILNIIPLLKKVRSYQATHDEHTIVGICYQYGLGVGLNLEQAQCSYQRAIAAGSAWAIYQITTLMKNPTENLFALSAAYKQAADQGFLYAKYNLACLCKRDPLVAAQHGAYIILLTEVAQEGDFRAQYQLAKYYSLQLNFISAFKWYKKVCMTGKNTSVYIEAREQAKKLAQCLGSG